jgi:hypothetical protein
MNLGEDRMLRGDTSAFLRDSHTLPEQVDKVIAMPERSDEYIHHSQSQKTEQKKPYVLTENGKENSGSNSGCIEHNQINRIDQYSSVLCLCYCYFSASNSDPSVPIPTGLNEPQVVPECQTGICFHDNVVNACAHKVPSEYL